jgi:hypothetical protein
VRSSRLSGISVDPGDGEETIDTLGGRGEGLFLRELVARLVGTEDVREVERVRRRRHVGEVQLLDLLYAVQDRVELPAYLLYLIVCESQPRQIRNVAYLLFGYHARPPGL